MNIQIPYSWLKDYLKTDAHPKKIAECLSLCGASVEKVKTQGKDFIFDIEITTNRIDMVSIAGIARELAAILPQFGIKAKLLKDPYQIKLHHKISVTAKIPQLKVIIKDKNLCSRFSAVLINKVIVKPSPILIQERLKKVGLRPINNIVDTTNYLMHELGQPFHVFDLEQIKKRTMILRKSKAGEKITTLNDKTYSLAGDDIVIEDGEGRLIDLCGLMGGQNSQVTEKTKSVLLFVQNYNPVNIRKTTMSLGLHSEASFIFEKSPDPNLVLPAIMAGLDLLLKLTSGKIGSDILDLNFNPPKAKELLLSPFLIKQYLGVAVPPDKVREILTSLGFKTKFKKQGNEFEVTVCSWRLNDVQIPQDLIEEIARIYGYHNLPSILPSKPNFNLSPQSQDFFWESAVKKLLKNWGLTETYSYSLQAEKEILDFGLDPSKHLKTKNPLTLEWVYLRTSLIPSLLTIIKLNQNLNLPIKIFELANIYLPQTNDLPLEFPVLTIASSSLSYFSLKGLCEAMIEEMGIKNLQIIKPMSVDNRHEFTDSTKAVFYCHNKSLGHIGEIKPEILTKFQIKEKVFVADFDFKELVKLALKEKKYQPIITYPPIFEDLTFTLNPGVYYHQVYSQICNLDPQITKVELKNHFQNNFTFQITYQNSKKNLTNSTAAVIRKKIVRRVMGKHLGKLKGKLGD